MSLLRPPAHRGPLIAAGAVVLATGLLLAQLRLSGAVGLGVHLLAAGLGAALLLALGWQARLEGGVPAAYQSVLLVTGLVLLGVALLRLAEVLGAGGDGGGQGGGYPSGAVVWTSLVFGAVAGWIGLRRASALCVSLAALAGVIALLHAVDWLFSPGSPTVYRVLLVLMAGGFVLLSLAQRGGRYRTSVLLVDVAGLLILALGATLAGSLGLFGQAAGAGTGWESVVLVCGCGLIAFGAVDHQPGPAFLGALNLAVFVAVAQSTADARESLLWWPLLLILLGIGVIAAGLRPSRPLPPEPPAYGASDLPLASRTDDEGAGIRPLLRRVRGGSAPDE